nr:DUF4143 domain-containing protein [Nesterenkonia muleiensis]
MNYADLFKETGVPATTIKRHVALLEALFLVQRVPAWERNLSKREVSRPKVSLLDTGLAGYLINVGPGAAVPGMNPDLAGNLLEGFVAAELKKQLTWSEERAQLYHFRDHDLGEVDLGLETPDGRVAGIEVKATSNPSPKQLKGLKHLRDSLGDRFVGCLLLHTGPQPVSRGDRLASAPLDSLWLWGTEQAQALGDS